MSLAPFARGLGLLIGLFGLILQGWLSIPAAMANGMSLPAALVYFFSFFTIQVNILAVLAYAGALWPGSGVLASVFASPRVQSAILTYSLIVALVYVAVLRHLWNPQGWLRVADETLHYAAPGYFALHWALFVEKGRTGIDCIRPWLRYPLIYLIYVLARGAYTGMYPYGFLEIPAIGYVPALRNIALMIGLFILVSALVIIADRLIARTRAKAA